MAADSTRTAVRIRLAALARISLAFLSFGVRSRLSISPQSTDMVCLRAHEVRPRRSE